MGVSAMKLIIEQPDGKRHYSRMARANDAPSVAPAI
jgi:hypothetical protein